MKYSNVTTGIFLSRPNRFIAYVDVDGTVQKCHVKNTGRCKELLVKGAKVYLQYCDDPSRVTKYDLISVVKGDRLINIDSQAPNDVAEAGLGRIPDFLEVDYVRREFPYGDSRIDIMATGYKKRYLIEVKGVTLEDNGVVRFPDAPTIRGVKHIRELIGSIDDGYIPYLLFVIQMENVDRFEPNRKTDPAFADALKEAYDAGVKILAYDCKVTPDSITLKDEVEVTL